MRPGLLTLALRRNICAATAAVALVAIRSIAPTDLFRWWPICLGMKSGSIGEPSFLTSSDVHWVVSCRILASGSGHCTH